MFSWLKKKELVDASVQKAVASAIKNAESRTSGEIRVYIESECKAENPLERAHEIFRSLKMEQTTARNAILIYLATNSKKFALFGDVVIYEKAGGQAFWQSAADKLKARLRNNEIALGLTDCIDELGTALAKTFPFDPAIKKNELPDEIVFGK